MQASTPGPAPERAADARLALADPRATDLDDAFPAAPAPSRRELRVRAAVLAAIVLLAAALRFIGLNWDEGHMLHPDERFVTMVTGAVQFPANPWDYFDTEKSTLNPYNRGFGTFAYGTAPLFFVRALADLSGTRELLLLGRGVSALADIGTVLMLFLLGCRLFSWRIAALACLLVAVTPMHIQQAHFYTMDSIQVFLVMVALYFAVRVAQQGDPRDYALLGVFYGLATASKISAATFGLVVVAACAVRAWYNWDARRRVFGDAPAALVGAGRPVVLTEHGSTGSAAPRHPSRVVELLAAIETPLAGCLLALLLAAIVFRIGQPYAFQGPNLWNVGLNPKYVADMTGWQKISTGEIDQPPSVQWANRTPYVYALEQMVRWGMGVPLGLAAWSGVIAATVVLLRALGTRAGRARWLPLVVPLVWIGFNWYYWGKAFANAMRYFLPIYPLLILLASWALVGFIVWARRGPALGERWSALQRWLPAVASALLVVVVGYTALYGLAYMSIYLQKTTRVAASEWIMLNLPPGTRIANEHWDDPVPLRVQGRDSLPWAGPQLELYAEEDPAKRERLLAALDQADVIAITSSRLYSSIPRIPERYPLATEYYRLLFSGELGFAKIAEFTSYPRLGPLIFLRDDDAQELWVNYDHPKVMLFRKTPAYSSQRARELLSRVNLDQVVKGLRSAQAYTHGLLMAPEYRATQEAGGTWWQIVERGSVVNAYPAQAWWLLALLLGLATYPLVWAVFGRLADRGYGVAKIVAIGLLAWGAWLLASLRWLPYSRESILLVLALLVAAAGLVLWRRWTVFWKDVRERLDLLLTIEAVFAVGYVLFLAVRMANPDLWHSNFGGEKPMDFAYLNAVLKSTYFPPYDPWFAGGYINYYYFGQVLVATLIRLTGVVPAVAYNLAIALFFGLLASACFSFAFNVIAGLRGYRSPRVVGWATVGGLLAVGCVAVFGNLDGLLQVLERVTGRVPAGLPFDFWRSTRVIGPEDVPPITEFPYFTFLYADLHAHLLALPLTLLALHVALALARSSSLVPAWNALRGRPGPNQRLEAVRRRFPVASVATPPNGAAPSTSSGQASQTPHLRADEIAVTTPHLATETSEASRQLGAPCNPPLGADGAPVAQPPNNGASPEDRRLMVPLLSPRPHERMVVASWTPSPVRSAAAVAAGQEDPLAWPARLRTVLGQDVIWLLALGGLVIGLLRMTNTWDFPTYLALLIGAGAVAEYRARGFTWGGAARVAAMAAALAGVAALVVQPYASHYALFYTGFERLNVHTSLMHYLTIHGFFLFALGSLGLYQLRLVRRWWHRRQAAADASPPGALRPAPPHDASTVWYERWLAPKRLAVVWAAVVLGGAGVLVLARQVVPAVVVVGLGVTAVLVPWHRQRSDRLLLLGMVAVALALTAVVEFVALRGDIGRMNTVFKFYMQVWVLFGLVSAVGIVWLLRRWRFAANGSRLWGALLAGLIAACLIYPVQATPVKTGLRFANLPPTLDGMAYMQVAVYQDRGQVIPLQPDYEAIRWIQDHIPGSPTILEAHAPEYRWGSRVSIYTGLPTVIGWNWHQRQQRGDFSSMVLERVDDVQRMYETTSRDELRRLLTKYGVEYIYVGPYERAYYAEPGLRKFRDLAGSMLDLVYDSGPAGVQIYRVRG
ncbi:MAG: glycosyltransferase family 39 protein [Chloroflexi bacterium]|nr:glycosyltransferase family 39 protein [Chloroflexota bacterium]